MSPQRSAALATERTELIRSLLRRGGRFLVPTKEVLETATWLSKLGIIEQHRSLVVRCAHPLDQDFPPPVADCDGLVALRPHVDEGGGDYRCPSCDRLVYPTDDDKRRWELLTAILNRSGIEAYLIEHCGDAAAGRAFENGVLTLAAGGLNAFVCLADFCTDRRFLGRNTAIAQPCVYVTVEPDAAVRVLKDEAISHVELADILAGQVDLPSRLTERAMRGAMTVANVDIPVYALGPAPIGHLAPKSEPQRQFVVSWSIEGFFVDGLLVVETGRMTACRILRMMIERFTSAIASGKEVRPMSVEQIGNVLEKDEDDARDTESIRKTIDRLRDEINNTVRRTTGKPIADYDIIETVSRTGSIKGAKGYRMNPRTVTIGAHVL